MIEQGPLLVKEKIRVEILKCLYHANRCETACILPANGAVPQYENDRGELVPMIELNGDYGHWAIQEGVLEALEPLLAMTMCGTGLMKGAPSLVTQ